MPIKKPAKIKAAPPKRPVAKKKKEKFRYLTGKTSSRSILVAFSDMGIVTVILREATEDLLPDLQQRFPKAQLEPGNRHDKSTLKQVINYIDKCGTNFDLPLDIRGTDFQRRVWRAVRKIPLGQTSTYSEIAQQINAPRAMRAVGSSCTNNLFAYVIPCHRVLHKDGSLSARQRAWIDREKAAAKKISP